MMPKRSAVAGLLDSLEAGLARADPRERKAVLTAGARLLDARRQLLAKGRRRAAAPRAKKDRTPAAG
jgi:hypothetical protein